LQNYHTGNRIATSFLFPAIPLPERLFLGLVLGLPCPIEQQVLRTERYPGPRYDALPQS